METGRQNIKTIAILLTVHNRKQKTLQCLRLVYEQKLSTYSIFVYLTDDGCTDGTVEELRLRYPKVNIINGDGTLFWNRGMYTAWQAASKSNPDYYLWLNDDTKLFEDSLEWLLYFAEQTNGESILVGSTLSNGLNKVFTYGGMDGAIKHKRIQPDDNVMKKCITFNGNIVLIPRNVFSKLGFNDFYYRHSFGDIDYGMKATKYGLVNYIAPGYYGICERNNPIPLFRRRCYSLIKRYKFLYSPLGSNPFEAFHLNVKYYPLYKCIWLFLKLHINVLFTVDHTKFDNK